MIYLDNAATTYPKPKSLIRAIRRNVKKPYGNPGRGSHALSIHAAEAIYEAREAVADFLDFPGPERIVFTSGATHALNVAMKGSIPDGSHVLISDLEHNSVFRPIETLSRERGVVYDIFSTKGDIEANINRKLRPETRFIVTTLASNVTGKRIPLEILSKIRAERGICVIADAAQLIGHHRISLRETPIDILCAPGHKGLFGWMGAGFLVIGGDTVPSPIFDGGSGSHSRLSTMPQELPDRLEAGTLPLCPILSIKNGIDYLKNLGWAEIHSRMKAMTDLLTDRIDSLKSIERISDTDLGICSIRHKSLSTEALADHLIREGIYVRSGLHCAPLAHQAYGTIESGTVRISLSILNTRRDIDSLYKVLCSI